MPIEFDPKAIAVGVGDVQFTPIRAQTSRGFGPWEVHPQRVKRETGGSVELVHNGDWMAHHPEGWLAFRPTVGGRQTAERFAVFHNAGAPTRVVDLVDDEHVSEFTRDGVQAALDATQ